MSRSRVGIFIGMALLAVGPASRGYLIADTEPAMTWERLVACPLVVVGKYKADKDGVMTITVERVLKGEAKAGQTLEIALQHWWSVEKRPVGYAAGQVVEEDGIARICYKHQLSNPGPLVSVEVLEGKESAIFFLPDGNRALVSWGQIQPAALADGWQQALEKKPMDLLFRLGQGVDEKLAAGAVEELKKSRDGKVLDALAGELLVTRERWAVSPAGHFYSVGEHTPGAILRRIGDQEGDVYERVVARVEGALKDPPDVFYVDPAGAAAGRVRVPIEVLAAVDPGRAFKQISQWVAVGKPAGLRKAATAALRIVASEPAMDMAISLINDKEVGGEAVDAVRYMATGGEPGRPIAVERQLALWTRAKAGLAGKTMPGGLSERVRNEYTWLVDTALTEAGRPK